MQNQGKANHFSQRGGRPDMRVAAIYDIHANLPALEAVLQDIRQSEVDHVVSRNFVYPPNAFRIVKFSPDGKPVLALIGHTIHLLRSQDLTEIRTMRLFRPEDETQPIHGKAVVIVHDVHSAEISPDGNLLAVLWVAGPTSGKLQLYDVSTGIVVATWNTPTGWLEYAGRLRWHPNGKLILIPIPNSQPCRYANHRPDVFAFDEQTGNVTPSKVVAYARTDSRLDSANGRFLGLLAELRQPRAFKKQATHGHQYDENYPPHRIQNSPDCVDADIDPHYPRCRLNEWYADAF
jgi:hypothetical protein